MARIKRLRSHYAEIPNSLLNSKELSLKSKGLWAYMQSKDEDWNFTIASMSKQLKEDERAIMTAMKELKLYGWLSYKKYKDGTGDYILQMGSDEIPNPHNADKEQKPNPHNSSMLKQQSIIKKDNIYNSILKIKMSDISISGNNLKYKDTDIEVTEKELMYFVMADKFRKVFIKNLKEKQLPTNHQEKAVYKSYVTEIRLMVESDGVSIENLVAAYDYLNNDDDLFWKKTILSLSNLRKNITRILASKT